jgi:dipeptide/tripeptide permease
MMLEVWWKVFLASLATVGLAKLLGSSYGFWALFAMAWIGWTVVLLGFVQLPRLWRKPRKGEDQGKPGA